MTLIVGNVMDVGLGPLDGTLRVWAGFRPEGVGLIAPVRRVWDVKAGQLPGDVDVTPGPAKVQFDFGMDATAEFPVVVPDVAQVTIQDLLLLHFAVDPFPVQEVMRDRLAAEAAAAAADGSATEAEASATAAALARTQVDAEHEHIHLDVEHADAQAAASAQSAQIAIARAAEASTGASTATARAAEAAQSAANALTYRNTAQGAATTATTKAGEATGAATTATTKAAQAAADALTLARRVDTGTRQVSWTSDGRPYLDKTATVGVPLRVDKTVGTRVMLGDQMVYGDTGVREVYSLMGPEFTLWSGGPTPPDTPTANSFLRMQRVGEQIHLWGRIAAAPELDGLSRSAERSMVETTHGFRPDRNFILVGQWASFSDGDRGIIRARGNDLSLRDGAGSWKGGELIYLNATWSTRDPWPNSLPGVPG